MSTANAATPIPAYWNGICSSPVWGTQVVTVFPLFPEDEEGFFPVVFGLLPVLFGLFAGVPEELLLLPPVSVF